MRRALSAAGVTALLLVLGLRSADAAVVQIKMAQVAYAPAQVTAHVGDTIEWINEDIVAHTATARSGAWDVTVLWPAGVELPATFARASLASRASRAVFRT